MDRRTLLAIALSFAIFVAWQKFYIEPRFPAAPVQTTEQSTAMQPQQGSASVQAQAPAANNAAIAPAPAATQRPSQMVVLKTGTGDAILSDGGKFFADWNLRSYKVKLTADASTVSLQNVVNHQGSLDLAFDDPSLAYLNTVQGTLTQTAQGARWIYEDANVKLIRDFTASENQAWMDVALTLEFKTKRPNYAFLSIINATIDKDPEEQDRQLVYWTNNSLERITVKDAKQTEARTPLKYMAATSRYFLMAVIPQGPLEARGLVQPLGAMMSRGSLVFPIVGDSVTIPFRVYFGPKVLDLLRSVEPTLDNTVDLGWFTIFAYPLLKLLNWFFTFMKNYGLAIILLTVLLKIVTYPLTYKSMKSMKEMAKLQPQLAKLREKYANDKEALNREMMAMMRSHGYNPMAGCMPILIQMPIFIALYRVLYSSIELYQAPFYFWIHDLSAQDPFYITPILLTITMYIQQKLTPNTATDPMQAKMLQFMPVIFGAMMINLPSGLTLYMLTNALASIVQQIILNKKLDTGNVAAVPARSR